MKNNREKKYFRLLQRKSAVPLEKVTPIQAFEWCQNFLGGTWSNITIDQMRMERVPYVFFNKKFFYKIFF